MIAIVACDRKWNIGNNGKLLFRIKKDLERFRTMTLGKKIVMGRKTFESLPGQKALPGRDNYVLTRSDTFNAENVHVFHDVDSLIREIGDGDDVVVIGGGEIYNLLMPYCSTVHMTEVFEVFEGDTQFPELPLSEWCMGGTYVRKLHHDNESGLLYAFLTFHRYR